MADNLEETAGEDHSRQLLRGVSEADMRKYQGKYVAFASFNSRDVVVYGKDICKVLKKARRRGIADPVICFVPDPRIDYIYAAA